MQLTVREAWITKSPFTHAHACQHSSSGEPLLHSAVQPSAEPLLPPLQLLLLLTSDGKTQQK